MLGYVIALTRFRVSFANTLTAACGFFLFSVPSSIDALWVFSLVGTLTGIHLLASGCCALNGYQERFFDSLMPRTAGRPVPSGKMQAQTALIWSLTFLVFGCGLLFVISSASWLILCLVLVGCIYFYNFIYTPLKRINWFSALFIGSVVGSLPPLIGWVMAYSISGDDLGIHFSPMIMFVCLLMFMIQWPHAGLLLLIYGHEYKEAGYAVSWYTSNFRYIRIFTCISLVVCLVFSSYVVFLAWDPLWFIWALFFVYCVFLSFRFCKLILSSGDRNNYRVFREVSMNILLWLMFVLCGHFVV